MLTFGQKAVGLTFNPSGDETVNSIKTKCAELIDMMNEIRVETNDADKARLCSVAITELQGAQMWAVKAAAWNI